MLNETHKVHIDHGISLQSPFLHILLIDSLINMLSMLLISSSGSNNDTEPNFRGKISDTQTSRTDP